MHNTGTSMSGDMLPPITTAIAMMASLPIDWHCNLEGAVLNIYLHEKCSDLQGRKFSVQIVYEG